MEIKFWGVRGSIPTPGSEFSEFGGNTSCVEVKIDENLIVFDMGSGLKNLGESIINRNIRKFDILISHFHYDHTCGLPFFRPAFTTGYKFSIRSGILTTREQTKKVLQKQISSPSFPITIDEFLADVEYNSFKVKKDFYIGKEIKIKTILLNHPDGAVGYRVENKNKSICYITDHEHDLKRQNKELMNFVKDTDALIYDCTYDDEDFKNYIGWGHSTWQEAVRMAQKSSVKKLFVYHHNPENNDNEMKNIESKCAKINKDYLVAREGKTFTI